MTVTASPPTAAPGEAATVAVTRTGGLAGVLGSGDHKVVGRLWLAVSVIGLLATGIVGALVSVERVDTADLDLFEQDVLGRLFSFHSVGGAFLFLLPLTIGVATAVVPLQIGAATIAFPRAAAAALWAHVLGAGILVGGYLADGGPFSDDVEGTELYLVGLLVVLGAQVVAWVTITTTVVTLRAPGLRFTRTPLFSWSTLVAGVVWLLTLPVVAGLTIVAFVSFRYGQELFDSGRYDTVTWVFGQPAVYAFAIVALGVIGEVVPVFAGTRHRLYRIAMGLIGAYGVLALGVWTLPSVAGSGTPWLYEEPWMVVSFAAVLPVLGLLGLWADTARRGKVRLASPLLFGLAAGLMLLVGVAAGAVQAIEPIETLVDGEGTTLYATTWRTSVAHYVVAAATIALVGAVTYWAPKMFGKVIAEGAARAIAVGALIGTVLTAFPELVAGLLGQQSGFRGVSDNTDAIEALNLVSAIGGGLLLLTALGWVLLLLRAVAAEGVRDDDPWGGHTLEWATSSPPPPGNFAALPEISSEAPLYDARAREEANA